MTARGRLWAVLAGLALALMLAPAAGSALGRLAQARADRAALQRAAGQPETPMAIVSPGLAVAAPGADAAAARIAAGWRARAKASGVLIEEATPLPAPAGLVRLRVRLSGPEKAVVALVEAVERGAPAVRLAQWRLGAADAANVRLDGVAVAAWR